MGKVAERPPNMQRRRRESNPCTGLCRPLPKPLGHSAIGASFADGLRAALRGFSIHPKPHYRADDGIRTRDPHLGKVMLYQLSHVRMPVRGDLGPVRRIAPALRQNFIRSSRNHQLEAGVGGKNLFLECAGATLLPALPQVRAHVRENQRPVRNDHPRYRCGRAPLALAAAARTGAWQAGTTEAPGVG